MGKSKTGLGDFKHLSISKDKFPEGTSVNDFDLLDTLGTGTFARVHHCRYKPTGKFYAMKVLKKAAIVRLKQVEHIRNEKDILASIDHPYIVNYLTSFQDSTKLYMVLEFVSGGELFSHLRKAGRFDNAQARHYAAQIVLAFDHLHQRNTIYRDLKPENLLLDAEGHVKVTDFGFAKRVEGRTWTLCGTPEYLAPEIIQSKGHGKAVDWWALGILIFEMLAGYPPFYDDNPFGIYEKILSSQFSFPSHFSSDAKDLIKKLLTADRTKRFGCMKNGAEDIKKHKFFKGVDWIKLEAVQEPSPFHPEGAGADSSANFDTYPDSEDEAEDLGADDPFGDW